MALELYEQQQKNREKETKHKTQKKTQKHKIINKKKNPTELKEFHS